MTNAGKLLNCLESIALHTDAQRLFYAIDCSVTYFGGAEGLWIQKKKLERALETSVRFADALKSYWILSGKAAAAKQLYDDH